MFSTSTNGGAQRTPSNAGAMEAKIHGMADSLRRQRDEAHRKSLTAAERVRLVQQEAEAMAATVDNMQNQYKTLQEKAAKAKKVETLATQVQEKTQQVRLVFGLCYSVCPDRMCMPCVVFLVQGIQTALPYESY